MSCVWREVPILVISYNRPAVLRSLIDRLRELGAKRIYVAIDGPKPNSDEDFKLVESTRTIARNINWTDETHCLFQPANLGCGLGVKTALDWFFSHVSEGIILEDDIFPGDDFLPFCSDLLSRYRHDPRVFAISGFSPVPSRVLASPEFRYRFSAITQIWGWATWARSWKLYSYDLTSWRKTFSFWDRFQVMESQLSVVQFWSDAFDLVRDGKLDTWDYQLAFAQLRSAKVTATSNVNLVENRGFGPDATHTRDARFDFPISNARFTHGDASLVVDHGADMWMYKNFYGVSLRTALARLADRHIRQRLRT